MDDQAAVMQRLWAALPDARFEITHLAVDGDVVICIGTMSRKTSAWPIAIVRDCSTTNGFVMV